jgi:hypothetical protein
LTKGGLAPAVCHIVPEFTVDPFLV